MYLDIHLYKKACPMSKTKTHKRNLYYIICYVKFTLFPLRTKVGEVGKIYVICPDSFT